MIGYVTLGTDNLKRAAEFYDELLAELGARRFMDFPDQFVAWATGPGKPGLSVTRPFDGQPATVGNGVMIALEARDRAEVDRIHEKALSLGAADEGAPGPREGVPGFYAGYFRDPDGHKLNIFHMAAPG